jgi:hypothetical protein
LRAVKERKSKKNQCDRDMANTKSDSELRSPGTLAALEGHGYPALNDKGEPILNENGQPVYDYCSEDVMWRLDMPCGHLSDYTAVGLGLVKQLKLRANAGHTTRSNLAHLWDLTGSIGEHLRIMREEIAVVRGILCRESESDAERRSIGSITTHAAPKKKRGFQPRWKKKK